MGVVDVCPKKPIDITTASKKLGCTNDTYRNNRYMCVPKENKASLFEFCYDGNMGIEEGGACLEASFGGIRRYNCSGFNYGCPGAPFHRYNVHKYPACQEINTKQRCYVSEPSCPSQRTEKEERSSNIIINAAIGVVLFTVVIFAAVFLIRKFFLKKAPVQSNPDGEDLDASARLSINPGGAEDLDASARLSINPGGAEDLGAGARLLINPENAVLATKPLPNPNNEAPVEMNQSVLSRTSYSVPVEMNQSVVSRTSYPDKSIQNEAIHSCNEFGTLYKDQNIASYEAEEKNKGMKVSIRFKEDKADKKEQPEEILNESADMFRLKREGRLATFKLLYEEDEEQCQIPGPPAVYEAIDITNQVADTQPIDEGHSAKPFGNGVG